MQIPKIACLLLLLLQIMPAEKNRIIARDEARRLLLQGLQERGYPTRAANFSLEDVDDPYFPNFYSFQSYSNLPQRFASTGVFAVNKKTADVWDSLLCKRVESRKIKSVQKKLQEEIGLSAKDYITLSKEEPCRSK